MRKYRHYGRTYTDFRTLAEWLRDREPFKGGAFAGKRIADAIDTGWLYLDPSWLHTFTERKNAGRIDYVIYSYATPIAWHDTQRGWIQPDIGHSATTTKHQNKTAVAISVLEDAAAIAA